MKKIIACVLLNVAFLLTASTTDSVAFLPAEELKLPILVRSGHLEFLKDCIPSMLSFSKDVDSARALSTRIDRMYGECLKSNPNFFLLIKPLIKIEADPSGHHMDFVMSDFRLSLLHLYAEKITPPVFTYDSAMAALAKTNGQERYESFIMIMSSFAPSAISLSRDVWSKIFTITAEQFMTFKMVTAFLMTKDFDEKATKMPKFLGKMFTSGIWDSAYWSKYVSPPSSPTIEDLTWY